MTDTQSFLAQSTQFRFQLQVCSKNSVVRQAGQHDVVDKARAASEEPEVLPPLDGAADPRAGGISRLRRVPHVLVTPA